MKLTLALAAILVANVAADGHDWQDVSTGFGSRFALDFEEYSMEVLMEGSASGLLATSWYTKDFNPAGAMFFLISGASTTIPFRANWCIKEDTFNLPSEVASAQTKRWKFTFYSGSLHIMCNDEEVLHLVFEEVCTGEDWREYWTTIPSYAQFDAMDQVSDKYRQAEKPASDTEDETEDETNQYTVIYTLWDDEDAPTTSSQYITVKGTNGQTEEYECNSENFRRPGAEVSCVIDSSVKIGNYRCLMLRTGGMDGLNFVRLDVYMNNELVQTVRASTAERKYLTLDDNKSLEFCEGDCDDDAAKCSDGQQCLEYNHWCNREYDCQDWSDEKNCTCLEDDDLTGEYYKGNVSITASGSQCVNWESKRLGSNLIKNYCRNPDDSDSPWCFTSDSYGYCDIPQCSEVREDEGDGEDGEEEGGEGGNAEVDCSNEEYRYHHECTGDDSGDHTEIDCADEENWDNYECYAPGAAQSQTICGVVIIAVMLFVGF